ncbi:plexin-A2-like isoform X3 [Mercenaria mercenaria]|uniref:plexin-A2-like isoform X3 n=1 Tax=Mercenaria mercenaria TaxID=6596 RepID=UPI00234EE9F1|nr:plexin-A2-like isoform X3 [Mercenaria mercenaria]
MEWKVVLLLLSIVATATGTNYITDVFDLDETSSQVFFQNAVMDRRTRKIYVGAKNRLYQFDENLEILTEMKTGPELDNVECPIKKYPCDFPKTLTPSYSKAILIDYINNKLIHCISLYQGVCLKHDINNIKDIEEPIPIYDDALVANNDSATTFAFIAPGPLDQNGQDTSVINIGVQYTNKGWKRDRVYCFATRKLDDFKLVYKDFFIKSATMLDSSLRQTFPIRYVYGFGSDGFSYMVTVQKKSPSTESYITKIFRVCQKDKYYHSYAEVQLECWHNGALYNLAQAAYLGKAGSQLKKNLNIRVDEDVLYASFSIGAPRSSEPTQDSALCVYPMRKVRRIFSANIQDCFNGKGNTGPGYFGKAVPCKDTPALRADVDDDYCGKHKEVNSPTDGTTPVSQDIAVNFHSTVTSLTVDIVNEYTVAYAGTKNGHILKIALETQKLGAIYEDVSLVEGWEIKPSMFVDLDHEYLYVMTQYKIMKMKLYDCSQYTTCSACLNAGNPYCGWCSLENKCSLSKDCSEYDQDLRWLSYSGSSCPSITSVVPNQIQKEQSHSRTTELQLNVSNLPKFDGLLYQCVFSYSSRNIRITTTNTTKQNDTVILCDTPETHLLPPIPTDHIKMNLSIHIWGRDFVSAQFTFFDCSLHKSCTSCTLSEFPCTWCIQNHVCTHNVDNNCQEQALVYGKNSVGQSPIGPDQCPRIELQGTNKDKILVPSGITKGITVKALHMKDFMKQDIRCEFFGVKEVGAIISDYPGSDQIIIQCDEVNFSYPDMRPEFNVVFRIYWRESPHSVQRALDNPEKIQVKVYKCNGMADTCGGCILLESDFECGWCIHDRHSCVVHSNCSYTANSWLNSMYSCPNVEINSIEPTTGPTMGGTKLTIIGKNLGKRREDIEGGISVAGVACNPKLEEYEPPHKIVCETGRKDQYVTGKVRVVIDNTYDALAKQSFTYVDPELKTISPRRGPVSGGTRVTINGRNLESGTTAMVMVGRNKCEVKQRLANQIICVTTNASLNSTAAVRAKFDNQDVVSTLQFVYIDDPVVYTVEPIRGIVSGGIKIMVNGTNLEIIQQAQMVFRKEGSRRKRSVPDYYGDCDIPLAGDPYMVCYSPMIPNNTVPETAVSGVKFSYGIRLDNVYIDRTKQNEVFTIYPDPIFEEFAGSMEKSYQSKTDNYLTINGRNLNLGFNPSDVTVKIGKGFCNVTSIDKNGNQLNCKPPKNQPASEKGSKYPEIVVQVGRNFSKQIGYLKYEKTELLPLPAIIGLGAGGGVLILVVIFFVVLWCIKSRENLSMKKKWQIQMDNLEVKVAKECKEAFAELQTDMTELTSDHFGQIAIPFWDYRTYCMRVLFPQDEDSHPVIRDLDVDPARREQIEHGLKLFSQLIGNRTFLLTFVRTLEANKKFSMRERVNVASLISVALQTRMEYATEILKTLLAELIEKSVEGKNHPKLLLRRTESVAEKMLTNWFTFLLYKFLRECAGEPLFMLYQAIKQQTSKGPVDSVTSEARYSLSEDKLIRQQVDYKPMTIYVQDMEQFGQQSHPVKVLDCDTISQVKEKILDAIYKNAPFSSRPTKQNVDLVLFAQSPKSESEWDQNMQKMILSNVDNSTKLEGESKKLNSLAHYQVPDGAYMALVPKQTPSIYDLSTTSEKSSKSFDYKRFGKEEYGSVIYSGRSPSLNRTASPQSVNIDIENSSNNGGTKYYHLVKQHDQENAKEGDRGSKMVSEIYLTRLLATKGTLQQFVDDLFERIFSTVHRGTSLPLAIKYMFDFLDDQALLHGVQDQDVVHTWKSNSLPLRFWVNVIKNPNFVFDIYKSNIVDSCLSVVAQNFMDSCSMSEHKLGKDSPSSKLLYAKDIPTYKKWVERYYQDIKMMPAISDQDMTAMMADESRTHQDEFNMNAALYELYKYVQHYQEDLISALDEDEFARKNRLNYKLEQVQLAMNGKAYC